MKKFEEIKRLIQEHKDDFRRDYGIREIGVFGSYVRGDQREDSDLDILIELEKPIGFVRFLRLEKTLSDILEIQVELVTKKGLKPYIGLRILKEVQYV